MGYRFRVEIEGLQAAGFTEVTGLETQVEVLSYREGGENQFEYKLPGPASYPSNLQLRHGLADPDLFWDWLVDVSLGVVVAPQPDDHVAGDVRRPGHVVGLPGSVPGALDRTGAQRRHRCRRAGNRAIRPPRHHARQGPQPDRQLRPRQQSLPVSDAVSTSGPPPPSWLDAVNQALLQRLIARAQSGTALTRRAQERMLLRERHLPLVLAPRAAPSAGRGGTDGPVPRRGPGSKAGRRRVRAGQRPTFAGASRRGWW